jgi:coenzyme F420 hydrogenase subunit beta
VTTNHLDLAAVLESEMCIGCGACTMVDPSLELVLDGDSKTYRPTDLGNPAAASVCPAITVDFDALQTAVFPGAEVTEHGVVESVVLAQSTNEPRNRAASSGGLVKEILHSLLERDDIDGIIALDEITGLDYQPRLLTEAGDIDQLPGSIYHAVDLSAALEILAATPGRFALVGIPCQLEGTYNWLTKARPDLLERVATTVGLLCGWLYSHHAIDAIAHFKRFDAREISHIAYRGGGPIGKLRITTPSKELAIGRRVSFDYQVAFDRSFNSHRCHVCINHSNFLADIVVGDAWLPSTVTTRTGVSLLICRTPASVELVRELETAERIVTVDASVEDITQSQTRRVVFGDFAYAYSDHLAATGQHRPEMNAPNRPSAQLKPAKEVAAFASELTRKRQLQRDRRYRFLWWRKATKELPKHVKRYLDWFAVRVLRIKSLTGQRDEQAREEMKVFR